MSLPELPEDFTLVPCAICLEKSHPQYGWVFVPHADNKWSSAATLGDFNMKTVTNWHNKMQSKEEKQNEKSPFGPPGTTNGYYVLLRLNEVFSGPHVSLKDAQDEVDYAVSVMFYSKNDLKIVITV
jgi:hypothetical protein